MRGSSVILRPRWGDSSSAASKCNSGLLPGGPEPSVPVPLRTVSGPESSLSVLPVPVHPSPPAHSVPTPAGEPQTADLRSQGKKRRKGERQSAPRIVHDAPAEMLSPAAVAIRLSVNRETVYRLIERGELPAVRLGSSTLRVSSDDLANFIDRRM